MPTIAAPAMQTLAQHIFTAAGTPPDLATIVADHLISASLAGHDSHGVLRIPAYVDSIRSGQVAATARPTVLQERPTSALISGNWGFGHVTATFATDLAIRKAKEQGVAVVGIVACNHIGRVGEYPTRAAAQGLASFVTVGGLNGDQVTPFGGREARLVTNPVSFGFPTGSRPPFLVDFATSAVAGGKIMLARAKGEALPEGLLLDRDGQPTTDPDWYFQGGAILPVGGHKGYGLSMVVGLFGALLTHAKAHSGGHRETGRYTISEAGTFILTVDAALFGPLDELIRDVDAALGQIKDTPPAPGADEVLIPGEPEHRSRERRLAEGIPVPDSTWTEIEDLAGQFGIALPSR